MEDKFKNLLDTRNADLFNVMAQQYNLEIKEAEKPGYATSFDERDVTIEVDMEDLNPHSFTHELLHIYLKSQDVMIAEDIKKWVKKNISVSDIFSASLQEHLGNCLEHEKMLPLYLERGFRNDRFVRDFNKKVMEEDELQELQQKYEQEGIYNRDLVDNYISKFYSMKTSNNPEYNYYDFFKAFEIIDPQLYRSLDSFWEAWLQFRLEDPKEKYQSSLDNLFSNLVKWKKEKSVV